jgi:hypothetical protein
MNTNNNEKSIPEKRTFSQGKQLLNDDTSLLFASTHIRTSTRQPPGTRLCTYLAHPLGMKLLSWILLSFFSLFE